MEYRQMLIEGKISTTKFAALRSGVQAESELLAAEIYMKEQRIPDVEPEHPDGETGGHEPMEGAPRPDRRKRVTIETGQDKLGNPIEKRTVILESDVEDPALEDDADLMAMK